MRSTEELVGEVLGTGKTRISVELPAPMADRLLACGRRKYGTLRKKELVVKAALYAAAIGLIEWERHIRPTKRHKRKNAEHVDKKEG